jgi:serine/threonine-protein kinase RsbW
MYSHFINIESDLDNIGKVETITQSLIDKHAINQDKYPSILIAVTEAVSNAILHGNKESNEKLVEIYTKITNGDLYIQVHDQGNGFQFDNLPDPTLPETIEEEGGRGILLIKELCDEIQFLNEGRIIEMLFKK